MAFEARFLRDGDVIQHTPSGAAVAAGEVIVVGDMVAVARVPIADGVLGNLAVKGIFDVDKDDGAAISFTAGQIVYWDSSVNQATDITDTGANKFMGYAEAVAANGDAKVIVRLANGPSA